MRPYFEDPNHYNQIFSRYRWVSGGFLPDPGLISDQSNRFMAYYDCIVDATFMAENDKTSRQESEAKAAQRKARSSKKPQRR